MANFGRSPEKSNFAQTCNRLSQYLKGKGHETRRAEATTLDLLPALENPVAAETPKQNDMASTNSMHFFAQQHYNMNSASSSKLDDASNRVDFIRYDNVNPEIAQMTIIYAGKVIVFNDFPAEKAKEIMGFAQKASNKSFAFFDSTTDLNKSPLPQHLHIVPMENASDMPIARKNSLHRFLKKRNDRVSARVGPYEREDLGLPPKPDQEKKWLYL